MFFRLCLTDICISPDGAKTVYDLYFRDHNSKVCMHLSKLRESAEGRNPLAEEDRDGTIHEAGNSIKCELEIVYNRLEMAYQLIERTLATGRIKTAWQ